MTSRRGIPQYPEGRVLLTDGGLETTLGYLEGFDVADTFAYGLLRTEEGRRSLADYYVSYAELAAAYELGLVLDTPTRQASAAWGQMVGDDGAALDWFNRHAVALLLDLRARHSRPTSPIVISGAVGRHPAGLDRVTTASWAAAYHGPQVRWLAEAGVDVITARCMTGSNEAIGIADAAAVNGVPCSVAFTIDADGRLPGGESLGAAIEAVDTATGASVDSYMIDCAPIEAVALALGEASGRWTGRVHGVRVHGSATMDRSLVQTTADQSGDPEVFGRELTEQRRRRPHLTVLGGCCGTDERHLEAMAQRYVVG